MAPLFRYVVRTEVTKMNDADGHEIANKFNARSSLPDGVRTVTGFYHVAVTVKKTE